MNLFTKVKDSESIESISGVMYLKLICYTEWKGINPIRRVRLGGNSHGIYDYERTQASSERLENYVTYVKTYWGK